MFRSFKNMLLLFLVFIFWGFVSFLEAAPTDTVTNTPAITATATNTSTNTDTNTATSTATNTASNTDTNTSTDTVINTPTFTPTPTDTQTLTATLNITSTFTNTPTNTVTATFTDTATVTITPTPTITATFTISSTSTLTPSPTATPTSVPGGCDGVPIAGFSYPNPASGGSMNVSCDLCEPGSVVVMVYDITGEKLAVYSYSGSSGTNLYSLNISTFAHGVYFLIIQSTGSSGSRKSAIKKFAIVR